MLFPMNENKKAVIRFAGDELFIGTTPSGHSLVLDTKGSRAIAPSPVEILLVALGSCSAVDVVSILEKKRMKVTNYVVEVSGQRRDDYPRKYTSMNVHHILTGKGLTQKAVSQAIELSETKYCSVAATFRPTVEIHSTFEIIEAES